MYDRLPTNNDVSTWTLDECDEYVAMSWESYGEMRGEAGMGAMSLGYGVDGAYEAASAVSQPADDPKFVAANARLEAARAAMPAPTLAPVDPSDIPF
jgi:hypothetical protein